MTQRHYINVYSKYVCHTEMKWKINTETINGESDTHSNLKMPQEPLSRSQSNFIKTGDFHSWKNRYFSMLFSSHKFIKRSMILISSKSVNILANDTV